MTISDDNQLILTAGADQVLNVWHFGVTAAPVTRLRVYVTLHLLRVTADRRGVVALGQGRNEPPRLLLFKLKNIKDLPTTKDNNNSFE